MASPTSRRPFVLGITGGSGSGKTFFLNCFLNHFQKDEVCLLSQDNYYHRLDHVRRPEENKLYNFDEPDTINDDLFFNDILKLTCGKTVVQEEYTFNNPNAIPRILTIQPAPLIMIEGLFILHFKRIATLIDYKIFIETNDEIALRRRIKRDLIERGYPEADVLYKWNNHVRPAYRTYLIPHRSDCNEIISNNTDVADDIIMISAEISTRLREIALS